MTQEGQLPPPPVMWAQRRDVLFVTICLEDCKDPVIKTEPEMIYFKGVGGTEQKMHEITINLYNKVVPNKTVQSLRGRTIELVLPKETDAPYWPRLTKEKTKAHWLKTDFNKWKDEVYSDDDSNMKDGKELEEMMRQMGGLGGSVDSKPDFPDLNMDDEEEGEGMDSDDDDLPELYDRTN